MAANNSNTTFRVYKNATPTNGTSFVDLDSNNSVVEVDTSGTDFLNGELQNTFILAKEETRIIDLIELDPTDRPGMSLTVTEQPSKANEAVWNKMLAGQNEEAKTEWQKKELIQKAMKEKIIARQKPNYKCTKKKIKACDEQEGK